LYGAIKLIGNGNEIIIMIIMMMMMMIIIIIIIIEYPTDLLRQHLRCQMSEQALLVSYMTPQTCKGKCINT